MSAIVCLQGGREFTPECDEMDRTVLQSSATSSIAVLAGAARVGTDHDGAVRRALAHYERLGVVGTGVPDPRVDRSASIRRLDDLDPDTDLLVLPGGSPGSLLDVLLGGDGRIAELVVAFHEAGGAISGASAGAMVLCDQLVRPDRGDVVSGVGMVAGLALPHWSAGSDRDWQVGDVDLWGLPECGGALIGPGAEPVAVGRGTPARRIDGDWIPLPR